MYIKRILENTLYQASLWRDKYNSSCLQ